MDGWNRPHPGLLDHGEQLLDQVQLALKHTGRERMNEWMDGMDGWMEGWMK